MSGGRAASAAGRLAHRVSPPTAGISRALRIPSNGGVAVQLRSLCHANPAGGCSASSTMVDTVRAVPRSWWRGDTASRPSCSPRRRCSSSERCWPRRKTTRCRWIAARRSRSSASVRRSVRSIPSTTAPIALVSGSMRSAVLGAVVAPADGGEDMGPIVRHAQACPHRPNVHTASVVRPNAEAADRSVSPEDVAALAGADDPGFVGEDHRLHAAAHAELGEEVAHVGLDRGLADE
jgi:hypothetical protein